MAKKSANLTKADLISNISDKVRMSKSDVKEVLGALETVATRHLKKAGNKVTLPGFLSFASRPRAERVSRNPRTGEGVTVPAHNAVTIRPGKKLKDAVRQAPVAK